ncbi:MAG: hypothetical protein PHO66_02050, partial [Eubacteriales bacterium]|nr:hypothetical protein [Eubacteriales bacterium]
RMVSHDRYFVQQTADDVLELADGTLKRPAARQTGRDDAALSALKFRRDRMLSQLSVMPDGAKRDTLEEEYALLCAQVKKLEEI